MSRLSRSLLEFIRNDSMSIALFGLFVVCAVAQSFTGWFAYRQSLGQAHLPPIGYGAYLGTGNFLDGAFSNWQAAVLQLGVLIAFGSVLHQKGAAHSKQPGASASRRTVEFKFVKRNTAGEWIYANSLSLAFFGLFAVFFVLHAVFGAMANDEEQALRHLPAVGFGGYVVSSGFWFTIFQTWEAEFLAIGLYVVLSIFLRQESSPESKPVGASDQQTGGANE